MDKEYAMDIMSIFFDISNVFKLLLDEYVVKVIHDDTLLFKLGIAFVELRGEKYISSGLSKIQFIRNGSNHKREKISEDNVKTCIYFSMKFKDYVVENYDVDIEELSENIYNLSEKYIVNKVNNITYDDECERNFYKNVENGFIRSHITFEFIKYLKTKKDKNFEVDTIVNLKNKYGISVIKSKNFLFLDGIHVGKIARIVTLNDFNIRIYFVEEQINKFINLQRLIAMKVSDILNA